MRTALLALGTRGDVALMTLLGQRLAARGAEVTLASSPFYADNAAQAGLGFEPVGEGGFRDMREALANALTDESPSRRTERFFERWVRPQLSAGDAALGRLVGRSDYFVSNLKLVRSAGRRTTPTARVTYDPPRSLADLDRFGAVRPEVIDLVALPRPLIDPEGRVDPRHEFTGFWMPEVDDQPQVAAELERFVSAAEGNLLTVTFGSMPVEDPEFLRHALSAAARAAGLSCVLVGAWSGVEREPDDEETLLVVPEAPYDWLFARSRCVVHHGSVGATSMAIRAGAPSIIAPFLSCQHDLRDLLRSVGLTVDRNVYARPDPDTLADAVRVAATDNELRNATARWSQSLARDRGADLASQRIFDHYEELFG